MDEILITEILYDKNVDIYNINKTKIYSTKQFNFFLSNINQHFLDNSRFFYYQINTIWNV